MTEYSERTERIGRLNLAFLAAFLLVALSIGYWSVARGPALAERGDNPRVVEAELRVQRGRILDSDGVVLAETVGPPEDLRRVYPIPDIGPAVGYYSFRHGTSGVEEGYNEVLRGDRDDVWGAFWQQNLHRAQVGQDIRLTLDAEWQQAADALMQDQNGALILLTLPEGAIRAMVSHPGYDPNLLDEEFEALVADDGAPLLNRATQGQYQPGLILQPFLLAAAIEGGWLEMSQAASDVGETVRVGNQVSQCRSEPPAEATWADVLQRVCPAPMLNLANRFQAADVTNVFERFGFLDAPQAPLATASPATTAVSDLEAALLGQDTLTVTPLQVSLAWAALANEGLLPQPELVAAVQDANGEWNAVSNQQDEQERAISAAAASAVLRALPRYDGVIAEHTVLALSGPGGSTNSWYLGLAPAGAPRYAVVVVVENTEESASAEQIGRSLLNTVLGE